MKKMLLAVSLSVLLVASALPALGVAPQNPQQPNKAACKHGHKNGHGLEAVIKDSLSKNNRDLAKVKQDVDKFMVQQKAQWEVKLSEKAKSKGMTVEELKAQFKTQKEQKMSEWAAKQGLTTEQLKEKMAQKHADKVEKMAKDLGLTTEELKQILPSPSGK